MTLRSRLAKLEVANHGALQPFLVLRVNDSDPASLAHVNQQAAEAAKANRPVLIVGLYDDIEKMKAAR